MERQIIVDHEPGSHVAQGSAAGNSRVVADSIRIEIQRLRAMEAELSAAPQPDHRAAGPAAAPAKERRMPPAQPVAGTSSVYHVDYSHIDDDHAGTADEYAIQPFVAEGTDVESGTADVRSTILEAKVARKEIELIDKAVLLARGATPQQSTAIKLHELPYMNSSVGRNFELRRRRVLSANITRAKSQMTDAVPEGADRAAQEHCVVQGAVSMMRDPSSPAVFTDDLGEEPVIVVQVSSAVPVCGRTAFAVRCRLSDPLATVRTALIDMISQPPRRFRDGSRPGCGADDGAPIYHPHAITLHLADSGDLLPLDRSLHDLGFRFPPLLKVLGFRHEYYLITCGSSQRTTCLWRPHMTMTDLCRDVEKRYRPRDFRLVRLSVEGCPDPLPIAQSVRFESPTLLRKDQTLFEVGAAQHQTLPTSFRFFRTVEGQKYETTVINILGNTLLGDACRLAQQQLSLEIDELRDAAASQEAAQCGQRAGRPQPVVFDDECEEASPDGVLSVFLHAMTPMATLSYNPTAAFDAKVRCPRFVPPEEDYTVRHASDCGVLPGSHVLVEFFDARRKVWSGDVLGPGEDVPLPHPHTKGTVEDYLRICSQRGQRFHMPVTPDTAFIDVAAFIWGQCGEFPDDLLLWSDAGRLLAEDATLSASGIPPSATIHVQRRPRAYLFEHLRPPTSDRTYSLSLNDTM